MPEPPQPQDKTASVRSRERLVSEGGTGARALGLAHAHFDYASLPNARAAQSPNFQGGNQDIPTGSGGPRGRREFSYEDDCMDDDDDDLDDKDYSAEAPLDRAFARLVDFIYERFPHSDLKQLLHQLRTVNMRLISLFLIHQSPRVNLCGYIHGSQKFKPLLMNMRLICHGKAVLFLECFLPGVVPFQSATSLTFVEKDLLIPTLRVSVDLNLFLNPAWLRYRWQI